MADLENLIIVKDLMKTYIVGNTQVNALNNVSLIINKGEFLAIMGASGSGKSTFMNILGCLDNPSSGTYLMEGIDVLKCNRNELAELRNRKLGFVFQSFNILPRTSALENVELPLLYNNTIATSEYRDKAFAALKAVGLSDRIDAMPNELSGGQQQRIAIARALVNNPMVIMADEPTGNLDSRTSYEIMQIFQKLNDEGITIVMVTHEPDIAQFAKTNIVFKDGKIIANEPVIERKNAVEELKKNSPAFRREINCMRILNLFKVAFRSLMRNKLRSFLTMLGIIIGVASVIAMLAIGEGSNQNIKASVASLGTNSIMIFPGNNRQGGVSQGASSNKTIKLEDVEAIALNCDLVNYVSPVDQKRVQVIYNAQNWNTVILGVTNDYLTIRTLTIAQGSSFTLADNRSAAKVCLVGITVVSNLFGDENANPVGQIIRINSIPVKIIGVLNKMGQNTFGQDQDDIIIAPFSTVQKRMMSSSIYLNSILASGKSEEQIEDAVDEISSLLREKHKIAPSDENDFTVRTQSDISNIFGSISKVMTILLASIAGISLLVGGIGIMNIMLVSVTERTREIGIRMAIGAKGKDILIQFMIESIVISFLGGLIGIALGIIASTLVARFGGWPVVITLSSVILSFLFSSAIGLFFGWYPASKAAALNPIDALRFE